MDFQSAMETFAEAWVAANAHQRGGEHIFSTQNEPLELTTGRDRTGDRDRAGDAESNAASTPRYPASSSPSAEDGILKDVQLHCLVESVFTIAPDGAGHPEMDTVISVPPYTPVQELVPVALIQMGYAKELAAAARGSIQLRNWNSLPLERIGSTGSSVGEMLGPLSDLASLRIQIFRAQLDRPTSLKDRLLKLMLAQHHQLLVASGCPIDENLMAVLMRGPNLGPEQISDEQMLKFETWLAMQQMSLGRTLPPWYPVPPPPIPKQEVVIPAPMPQQATPTPPQQPAPQKPRARTSFDPELELPRLQQWFSENQHPSRQQIQLYVKELNSLVCRRGRRLLHANNVVYWFKNARAALKKDYKNMPPGLQIKYMANGYRSNSGSPSEGATGISPGSLNQDSTESPETSPLPDKESPPPPSNGGCRDADETAETPNQLESQMEPENDNDKQPEPEQAEMSPEEEEPAEDDENRVEGSSSVDPRAHGMPMIQNSMFGSVFNMYYYRALPPQVGIPTMVDDRRKRNRTFIDPQTEVPRLEQWFSINTHPPHSLIVKYTEDLNKMDYRRKFPRLEPKNVQFWFKNRRAKCKRLKMALFEQTNSYQPPYPHNIPASISGESYQAH